MMMAGERLRVALATTHLALRDVPAALTVAGLAETLVLTATELQKRFGIAQPRLAICGLNPHAGEEGASATRRRGSCGRRSSRRGAGA